PAGDHLGAFRYLARHRYRRLLPLFDPAQQAQYGAGLITPARKKAPHCGAFLSVAISSARASQSCLGTLVSALSCAIGQSCLMPPAPRTISLSNLVSLRTVLVNAMFSAAERSGQLRCSVIRYWLDGPVWMTRCLESTELHPSSR